MLNSPKQAEHLPLGNMKLQDLANVVEPAIALAPIAVFEMMGLQS